MPLNSVDAIVKELDAIKKLLILELVASGVQAKDVAKVLGVTKSTVSRLVPARGIRKNLKANET